MMFDLGTKRPGSSGEPRKAELASLLNCRQVPVGADVVERMPRGQRLLF